MKPIQILGLTGRAGSGKDTAATMIKEALQARGKRVQCMAFADPMRWMLAALGVPMHAMMDRDMKEAALPGFNSASYRHMMQTLGTEWGRHQLGEGFWTERLAARLDALAEVHKVPEVLIITDVRFANEAMWITHRGGRVVRVSRPCVEPVRTHVSEQQPVYASSELDNSSDLQALRAVCNHLANQMLAEQALAGA